VCLLAQQYEYVQPWLSGIQWGAEYSSALPLDVDGDGLPEVVIALNDGKLHAIKADGTEPYDTDPQHQPPLWSWPLEGVSAPWDGSWPGSEPMAGWSTVAAGALDPFRDGLELAVGSPDDQEGLLFHSRFALEFHPPPWPSEGAYTVKVYTSRDYWDNNELRMKYVIWNSPVIGDANLDGSKEAHFVDECCVWRMFDGVGVNLQEGVTGRWASGEPDENTQVVSSPALGWVGNQRTVGGLGEVLKPPTYHYLEGLVVGSGDFYRDWLFELDDAHRRDGRLGDTDVYFWLQQLWAFDTIQSYPSGDPEYPAAGVTIEDFPKGYVQGQYYWITSSPALADFDGDGGADVAVGCDDGTFRIFYYAKSGGVPAQKVFARGPAINAIQRPGVLEIGGTWIERYVWTRWISSPAIAPLQGAGHKDVAIAGDDGYVRAYHISTPNLSVPIWATHVSDRPVQSSAAVADIWKDRPGGDPLRPLEIVVGSDDGKVYMLEPVNGQVIWTWDCRHDPDNPATERDQIRTTPLITDVDGDGVADIFVANDYGLFRLHVGGQNPVQWDPGNAPWPMFHKDIARKGALSDTPVMWPTHGSITSLVYYGAPPGWPAFNPDPVLPGHNVMVYLSKDGQRVAETRTTQDGRFIFNYLAPAHYVVQAEWLDDNDVQWQSIPWNVYVPAGYQQIIEPQGKIWLYVVGK
jgi:hypothetical protein